MSQLQEVNEGNGHALQLFGHRSIAHISTGLVIYSRSRYTPYPGSESGPQSSLQWRHGDTLYLTACTP